MTDFSITSTAGGRRGDQAGFFGWLSIPGRERSSVRVPFSAEVIGQVIESQESFDEFIDGLAQLVADALKELSLPPHRSPGGEAS